MKKLILTLFLTTSVVACFAQEKDKRKTDKKDAKRQKISDMIKQAEEGVLVYNKHSIFSFGNPYVFGKINNFYQLTLGLGQQRILGQKGNKNGVSVSAVANGGLAIGLLRPYYLEVKDPMGGPNKTIKYSETDKALFLDQASIVGGGGLGKGWGEMKIQPGAFAKAALRFDYGRFNELVSGIEIGLSADFYGSKIRILADQKEKNLFMQGYIAVLFGKRK